MRKLRRIMIAKKWHNVRIKDIGTILAKNSLNLRSTNCII